MTTTASIYFNKIDVEYPQIGKDNDSQGFRDNFANIKNAFISTNDDIETLQLTSVKLNQENDFGYNSLKKITIHSNTTKIADNSLSAVSGYVATDFSNGNYQKYQINGNTTFNITNWPSNFATVVLSVTPNTTSSLTINIAGARSPADGNPTFTPITSITTSTKFIEVWSDDSGVTVYATRKGA